MRRFKCLLPLCIIVCASGYAQDVPWVSWKLSATIEKPPHAVVHITADIAPGWHLYFHAVGKEGPLPTPFYFDRGAYALNGLTTKKKGATTCWNAEFETNITRYAGIVHFDQDIIVENPTAALTGKIEYMVCNNELCVPCEKNFSIRIMP